MFCCHINWLYGLIICILFSFFNNPKLKQINKNKMTVQRSAAEKYPSNKQWMLSIEQNLLCSAFSLLLGQAITHKTLRGWICICFIRLLNYTAAILRPCSVFMTDITFTLKQGMPCHFSSSVSVLSCEPCSSKLQYWLFWVFHTASLSFKCKPKHIVQHSIGEMVHCWF